MYSTEIISRKICSVFKDKLNQTTYEIGTLITRVTASKFTYLASHQIIETIQNEFFSSARRSLFISSHLILVFQPKRLWFFFFFLHRWWLKNIARPYRRSGPTKWPSKNLCPSPCTTITTSVSVKRIRFVYLFAWFYFSFVTLELLDECVCGEQIFT